MHLKSSKWFSVTAAHAPVLGNKTAASVLPPLGTGDISRSLPNGQLKALFPPKVLSALLSVADKQ